MRTKVKYAILKYVPNLERNERINIAVVLHYPEQRQIEMAIIGNWKRVKKFDDEADISFLKKYVNSLKQQFSVHLLNDYEGTDLHDFYFLDESTKYFVNKFIFEIHEIDTDSEFFELLSYLKKLYLYYEVEKGKRISENESKAFIEQHFLENNVIYEKCGSKNMIHEQYGNNINFDYKIGNKYYKLIFLTESNYSAYVAILKMWIANSIMLKKEHKELIFVVDDMLKNEKTKSYQQMLADYGQVITIQEFIEMKTNG